MGNCLKINNSDDISLLRGSESTSGQDFLNEPFGGAAPGASAPPIYPESPLPIIQPVFYPTQNVSRPAAYLTEEEQLRIAKRIGLIQHLPIGAYDSKTKKSRECVICMIEFCVDEPIRYLPCLHIYHVRCIDEWLMRNLTCPSCLEPVDAALLTSYETT